MNSPAKKKAIDNALAEYALASESGEPFDQEAFLAGHAEIRPELEELLEDVLRLNSLGVRLQDQLQGGAPSLTGLEPGADFGGYRIRREIGRGGMARVHEALEERLGRLVALKVFTGVGRLDARFRDRFVQEARIAASLVHDHVVPVHATGACRDIPFISMRLMEGGSLAERAGRVPAPELAGIALRVAQALAYAHSRGIVHRDIKPGNILLDASGRAYLGDFGLAVPLDASGAAAAEGTVCYLPPEAVRSPGSPPGPLWDIYSLGVSLHEIAAGRNPFATADPSGPIGLIGSGQWQPVSREVPGFPADLSGVIGKAMALHPGDRYQSAEEMAADLRRFLEDRPVLARPLSGATRLARWVGRNRGWVTASVLSAFVIVVLSSLLLIAREQRSLRLQGNLIDQYRREQGLTASAVANVVAVARTYRHRPLLNDQERVLLGEFLTKIEGVCAELPPEHPLRAEEALLVSQLYQLERLVGHGREAAVFRERAAGSLALVAPLHPARIDLYRELALIRENEGVAFLPDNPEKAMGKLDEALEAIDTALGRSPDAGSLLDRRIWILHARTQALRGLGRGAQARECLARAISEGSALRERYPAGHPLSYLRLAILLGYLGSWEADEGRIPEAIAAFESALEYEETVRRLFPGQPRERAYTWQISLDYIDFLLGVGDRARAAKVLERARGPAREFAENFPDLESVQIQECRLAGLAGRLAGP